MIDPKVAIESGWITHPDCHTLQDWIDKKFISPNAIDFTIDQLFSIDDSTPAVISESFKRMKLTSPIKSRLIPDDVSRGEDFPDTPFWCIPSRRPCDFMSSMFVNLPTGIVARLVLRSTFTRSGMTLDCGLYDSGYSGAIGGVITNRMSDAWVEPGTRVGQIIFEPSQSSGMYAGGWNHANGEHWSQNSTNMKGATHE